MKKTIFQFIFIIAAALASLFLLVSSASKQPSPDLAASPQSTDTSAASKMIIADLFNLEFRLYKNDKLNGKYAINKDNEPLIYFSSGEYAPEVLSSLKIDEEIKSFFTGSAPELTAFFVLSPETIAKKSIDEQGSYFLRGPTDSGSSSQSGPKLTAKSFLIGDVETGNIIFQKDKDKKMPLASLSKLITTLVAMEKMDQHKFITITKKMLEEGYGGYGNLRLKEQLTVGELLYPLLLQSSNDAAYALSMDYGEKSFVEAMNKKAGELGLADTFFVEPSGADPQNVSTTNDLFRLSSYIYKNQRQIFDITRLKSINDWRNGNYFVSDKRYIGGKNGYIPEIRHTSIALFSMPFLENEKRPIAVILIGSQDREGDTAGALKWVESKVAYKGQATPIKPFTAEETEQFAKNTNTVSITVTGNLDIGADARDYIFKNKSGDFSFLLKNVDFLKSSDLVLGNLRGPISDTGEGDKGKNTARLHPLVTGALKKAGFNALSVSGEEVRAWGNTAYEDTLRRLKNENILAVEDAFSNAEIPKPYILTKNNIKIGLLGFNKIPTTSSDFSGQNSVQTIETIRADLFEKMIKNAAQKTDILIVALSSPDPDGTLAKKAIDDGAEIVAGFGDNQTEGTENYKDGIIMRGFGSLLSDNNSSDRPASLAIEVVIAGDGKIKGVNKTFLKTNKNHQAVVMER